MHELFYTMVNYDIYSVYGNFVIYKMHNEKKYKLAVWVPHSDTGYVHVGEFDTLEEAKTQLLLESI